MKEEEVDTDSNPVVLPVSVHRKKQTISQIGSLRPFPQKVPEYARRRITLDDGQRIIRGVRVHGYIDELSYYFMFGNEVTLYKKHVDTLNNLIDGKKISLPCYVCTMNKTFATSGQQMYFSTHFTQEYLKGHMHEEHTNLLIKAGNGPAIVIARLIMGIDKGATITRSWTRFFDMANMKGAPYALPLIAS